MFSHALVILSDFALILLGVLLWQRFGSIFDRNFWIGAEKLVYYVLFPALLFYSINRAEFSLRTDALVLAVAVLGLLSAAALGFAGRLFLRTAPTTFVSSVQTAYRYNSTIGLALAQSLFGNRAVALLALIISICIPLANVIAVSTFARHGQRGLLRELAVNPLIISTVTGLVTNLLGWTLPPLAQSAFARVGAAALALGLICIGAGLTLAAVRTERLMVAYFITVKLVLFPAVVLGMTLLVGLHGLPAQVLVLFAALPTASTAYVLAARMGGDPAPVAFLVTLQTLAAMLTLPLWVALVTP